jgi:hypothetical protein
VLQLLAQKANTYEEDNSVDLESEIDWDQDELITNLSNAGYTTLNSLYQLVYRLRPCQSNSGKKRSRKSSGGKEWKALQNVVRSSLTQSTLPSSPEVGTRDVSRQSRAIALLTLGIILSFQQTAAGLNTIKSDPWSIHTTTKMVSSALLTDIGTYIYDDGGQYQLKLPSEQDLVVYKFSRYAVLDLLQEFTQQSSTAVDIQVINKLAHGFGIGERDGLERDDELQDVMSSVVDKVFGKRILNDNRESLIENEVIRKDSDAAVLSLVASTKPWNAIDADRLVLIAADHDLWFAAENLCDSSVESVVQSPNLLQTSVAHLTTRAIIDAALGYRQYRRADQFASKYYEFGGPERYAEARYLHACDTISKVIRKRVMQLIDKQVERVDSAVNRVREDITPQSSEEGSAATSIDTMSEHVREFSLRRLRAANMHSEALRLARLWNMTYDHDPVTMMEEMRQRKLTYLQWDDEGCPGHGAVGSEQTLPQLISEPQTLITQFVTLHENNQEETIGFDCEWGDDGPGVSLLQLSSTTNVMLLDIPALASTSEGCDALRSTVGKLFSGALNIKYVIGFSCKEDFSRLRASPSLGPKHWFPSHTNIARDLRQFIADTHNLGSRSSPLGLSAACEYFLGKALDKSEQCSDWSMRPLTIEQREYAALDAWACAAIHAKISACHKVLPLP